MSDNLFEIRRDVNGDKRVLSKSVAWWFDNGPKVQPLFCMHNNLVSIKGNKPS